MMKTISFNWAVLVGLLTVLAQAIWFFLRFGSWNTSGTFAEYLLFFVAGTLGGATLIFFLNQQTSIARRWAVLVGFLIASPIALFVMLAGGLVGALGVLMFPLIPWGIITWIGSLVGKLISRG